jgi:5'-deoxynucleotidase YfbR-like HD superfamily hydrolase
MPEDKDLRVRLAIRFLSALNQQENPEFALELESVWEEYQERNTKEARLVHDIDVYERLVQAKEYEVRGRGEIDFKDFFLQWEEMVTTPEVKDWTKSLLHERKTFSCRVNTVCHDHLCAWYVIT